MSGPALWFTFKVPSGEEWKVYLSNRCHNSLLGSKGGASGITYYERFIIEIEAAEQDTESQDSTVLHELLHVSTYGADLSPRKEESVVLRQEKNLWPILKSLGFRWPRRPAAYRRIREGR